MILTINTISIPWEKVEYINWHAKHNKKDCIEVSILGGTNWYFFGDKKYRMQQRKMVLRKFDSDYKDRLLLDIKTGLSRKRGRKSPVDLSIINWIENITI